MAATVASSSDDTDSPRAASVAFGLLYGESRRLLAACAASLCVAAQTSPAVRGSGAFSLAEVPLSDLVPTPHAIATSEGLACPCLGLVGGVNGQVLIAHCRAVGDAVVQRLA